jgi:hypothetical protein
MADFNEGKNEEGTDENAVKRVFDWLPDNCEALADGEYDAIIMGTGLTECIISGLLSVKGLCFCCLYQLS